MYYLENIITDCEANYFIHLAEKYKTESILTRDHNKSVDTNYRTSSTAYLKKGMNRKVKIIEERIASLLNINYRKIEPLQIVIYEKDQFFKAHLDTFYENSIELKQGGNRTHTILIYLNDIDDENGGKTIFTRLQMKIQPKKRNAIYFENMINGKIDNRLLHEGESLYNFNKKYIINVWIREEEYWN
jgi:prolyl 4-hydroxylase